jgi:hypothetical protein
MFFRLQLRNRQSGFRNSSTVPHLDCRFFEPVVIETQNADCGRAEEQTGAECERLVDPADGDAAENVSVGEA